MLLLMMMLDLAAAAVAAAAADAHGRWRQAVRAPRAVTVAWLPVRVLAVLRLPLRVSWQHPGLTAVVAH
jgi:hypothetical protein